MISFELLREKGILIVRPQGPLEAEDFRRLTQAVDPCIAAHFAHPEIKVFGAAEKARALGWLDGGSQ
jgi:hypothetical protein